MKKKFSGKKKKSIKMAVLATVISFLVFTVLYHVILRNDMAANKERYGYIARNQAEHIITAIDCVMSRTNTLKTLVMEHDGDTSWFDDVAEDIYLAVQEETGVSLKNFAIAPDGVVSDVYPLKGNEALIGFDFLNTRLEGNNEAKKAYENSKTILTNPFNLIQGGVGMGGRSSVVLKNDDVRYLWGLVTVTIDFDDLMEVIGLDNLQGMGVDYSLSYIDPNGDTQFMYGNPNIGNNTVKTRFDIRNLTWEIDVKPIKGWSSTGEVIFSLFIILILSCLAGLLTYMMNELRERNLLLMHLSTTDALTGCFNRTAYEEKMRELSAKKIDDDLVYVSADLNGLKNVNDNEGHSAGDELIFGATSCLQTAFGQYGSLYRIGGDEFAVLINADEDTLKMILKNIASITDNWKGKNIDRLSVSIGCASHREYPDMTVEELGKTADKKMYEAKEEYYQTHDRRRRG